MTNPIVAKMTVVTNPNVALFAVIGTMTLVHHLLSHKGIANETLAEILEHIISELGHYFSIPVLPAFVSNFNFLDQINSMTQMALVMDKVRFMLTFVVSLVLVDRWS